MTRLTTRYYGRNVRRSLFNHVKVVVLVGGRQSREVDTGVGLLQGSILPPILFNVYINGLPKTLRERRSGPNVSGTKINSLLYGDDIVLVTSSAQQLQNMLRTCERHSRDHKYEVVPPVYRKDPNQTIPRTLPWNGKYTHGKGR